MIACLKGEITFKNPAFVILETGGVGYQVFISLYTYSRIEKLEQVKILTHVHIKEDSHTLYGFADENERSLFRHLISVTGIGPSTAQIVLSSMQPDEVRAAILGERDDAFRNVRGIGPKTAKRIILDLKDKLSKEGGEIPSITLAPANNTMREEALSGLVALGFNRILVQKALNKILKEQPAISNVEALIKQALRELSS
ncbi:MAG: Holliday junction branch migration protein RuvA [Haliscomenobacter sp.]|nr:Holliday junction branch migration protein RuvA [Haliscomenobacter sp.]